MRVGAPDASSRPAGHARQPRQPIEVRREQVLDAALAIIAEHGFDAVTMEAIARRCGIAKPVVYNAYPGRGPLLQALLQREKDRGFALLAEAMQPKINKLGDAGTFELIMAWLSTLAYAIAADPQRWRLILITAEAPPEVREAIDAGYETALRQLIMLIEPALRRGGRPADAELVGHAVLATGERCARLMIDDPVAYPPQRLMAFAETSLRALRLT